MLTIILFFKLKALILSCQTCSTLLHLISRKKLCMLCEDFKLPIKIDGLVTDSFLLKSWWKKGNSLDLTRVAMISSTSLLGLEEKQWNVSLERALHHLLT